MRLRLHTRHQNSAGERVRIVLNLKNLAYDYIAIPSLQSEAYRTLNPQGLMPALEIDGEVVTQSLAIIELLEERFPEPSVYPRDPVERARARAFALAICSELHPVTVNRVRRHLVENHGQSNEAVRAWYEHWTRATLEAQEESLASRPRPTPFCYAGYPTVADAALVPQLANARRFGCDLNRYPTLVAIDARCREHDAFANARPDRQPDHPA